jgi:putative phage-type endonuclease
MTFTDEQRAARRTGLGASEVSAVLGLPSFLSPLEVWASKTEGAEREDSLDLWRGRAVEPVIVEWYERETGRKTRPAEVARHPRCKVLFATPDRMHKQEEPEPLEAKSVRFSLQHLFGESGTDEVPQQYLVQVQVQMACTGAASGTLAALFGLDELRVYRFARDAELEGLIVEGVERWWRDYVVTGKPPPVDGSPAWAERLARAPREEKALPATAAMREAADVLKSAKAAKASAEKAEAEARNRLLSLMEGADSIEGLCTYRQTKGRASTDWRAVVEDLCIHSDTSRKQADFFIEQRTSRTGYRVLKLRGGNHAD